jgi:hypothetical protein
MVFKPAGFIGFQTVTDIRTKAGVPRPGVPLPAVAALWAAHLPVGSKRAVVNMVPNPM